MSELNNEPVQPVKVIEPNVQLNDLKLEIKEAKFELNEHKEISQFQDDLIFKQPNL